MSLQPAILASLGFTHHSTHHDNSIYTGHGLNLEIPTNLTDLPQIQGHILATARKAWQDEARAALVKVFGSIAKI